MQAIQTKFLGPTSTRGARIKASCAGASLTMGYDHACDPVDNHRTAATLLRDKIRWRHNLVGGVLKDESYVWVAACG